jgi:hypothetical protein
MKEIFVIYNKDTGLIDGGAGRIDRDWDLLNADGSTISERISEIIAKDPNRKVAYLSYQPLPDNTKYKIEKGNLVQLTEDEKIAIKQSETDESKIQDEMSVLTRVTAIQNLKDKAELPIDYKDPKQKQVT